MGTGEQELRSGLSWQLGEGAFCCCFTWVLWSLVGWLRQAGSRVRTHSLASHKHTNTHTLVTRTYMPAPLPFTLPPPSKMSCCLSSYLLFSFFSFLFHLPIFSPPPSARPIKRWDKPQLVNRAHVCLCWCGRMYVNMYSIQPIVFAAHCSTGEKSAPLHTLQSRALIFIFQLLHQYGS